MARALEVSLSLSLWLAFLVSKGRTDDDDRRL
eukprot:CAMPEP_0113330978 /NCGR_PEP_ID=MMETSP0010_2-20120614/22139_1 /TAXON_ID=216773 ORGANISM="Corethron hystrix, Strain 308" /NCGR_SAMPLE_ID=MMETSP0010_2 /ASSEMBLY_ACC=CAM_ASM_000155 /LENGTH=31 /DNA_ID=CAMNT_0000194005 /DNA_START=28 /DNA_END=123 /DNA_ORIENTATION=+ /assembly_acc=CAM_ASM_000155